MADDTVEVVFAPIVIGVLWTLAAPGNTHRDLRLVISR